MYTRMRFSVALVAEAKAVVVVGEVEVVLVLGLRVAIENPIKNSQVVTVQVAVGVSALHEVWP